MTVNSEIVPDGILCARSHEYVLEEGNLYKVGITDHFAEKLGDVLFVELPEVGMNFVKGEAFSTVESVLMASELYSPVGGKIVEVNEKLAEIPRTLNSDPFGDGWLVKIESETAALDSGDLLEYEDYIDEL